MFQISAFALPLKIPNHMHCREEKCYFLRPSSFFFFFFVHRLKASDNRLAKYGNCPLFGVYVAPVRDDIGVIRIEDSVMIEM